MRLPPLQRGILVERENRFRARVRLDAVEVLAHVADPGRLRELLVPGRGIWLAQPPPHPARRTAYQVVLAEHDGLLVSVDARLPNALFAEALVEGRFMADRYPIVEREVAYGESRLDYRLRGAGGAACRDVCWVEVKGASLVRDGEALFPDAPTQRGARHLRALTAIVQAGDAAAVVFVVQRSDATVFRPYAEMDPAFAEALAQAHAAGVEVRAAVCRVSTSEMAITHEIRCEIGS
jgi:sugar fermentation stimulation protein A